MNTDQTLQQAITCHQAGQLQEAGEFYLSILQTDPNHVEANHKMGILALQMEQPAAALPYFMAALEAEPSCAQYWLGYIEALFQAGQPEEARQVLALARQQGLQGEETEALAARMENGTQVEEPGAQQAARPRLEEINAMVALFNEGRLTEAAALAQEMTERFPRHAFGWKALGAVFKQLGRNEDALAPMQKAAAMSPDDVEAHYNLGAVLQVLGRLDEAEASYRRALQINPDYAEAHSNLGSTLYEMGRLGEAEASIRRSLALNPDNPIALNNLGNTLQALDRAEEAEASYRRAIKIKPDYAEAHCNLGFTLKHMRKLEEAEASYRQTLRINPAYAQAHYNLGNTLKELNRLDEAEASYRQAIKIKPDFAEAYSNLGATLKDMNRPIESEDCLRRALEINPGYVKAIGNLGATLQAQNRLAEAEACYRQALKIQPDNPEANNNLGTILQEQNRFHEAEACYRMTLQAKPDFVEALGNLGVVLHELNRLVEAQACYRKALEINPEFGPAHLNLAAALAYLSDFDEVVAQSNAGMHLKALNAGDWERHLYVYSYHPDLTAGEIYAEFVRWGDRFPNPVTDFGAHDRTPGRRLKIGYVSPDFRRHTSRFFFWPLFANHDHAAVELYAYSNVGVEDEFTAGFKTLFDHWRPIRGMADDEVALMVREDGIDILVDACSHMRDDRLGVFTLKPAPIQVTWLGAAWTTGLKAVDYALIDPYMAPEGTLTRETIVRLSHCFVAFRPPEVTAEIAPPPCLKNGHITFGYSGRTERLNHHTFRVWGEILRQNPAARLILDFGTFADPLAQAHYRQFMARCGMNPDQVIMRNSADIFAGLNDFDILLDSFPHSGGTMLFDALWMGVPILTLASRPPVGRIGTSLMTNLGLPEWVAESEAEYIDKAATLSRDFQALAQLRAGMRGRMQSSPLMDGPGFARDVEAAYRVMFEKWAGEPVVSMNTGAQAADQTLQQAIACHQAGQLQEAGEFYLSILQTDPNHAEANHKMGILALQMEQPAAALPYFMAALEAEPSCGQYWLGYIEALFQAGQPEEARQVLTLARQQGLQGNEADALAARMESNEPAIEQIPQRAPEKAQPAKPVEPTVKSAPQQASRPALQEINALVALFNEGRFNEAAKLAQEMTERFPLHEFGWKALGAAFKQMGRGADALAPMQKAAAMSPDDVEAQYNLGATLQGLGRLDEAEASYRRALQTNPDYGDAHSNLGVVLHDLGRLNEAETSLRRALQIKPNNAEVHSNLGITLHDLGRLNEAEASIRRALELNPSSAITLNNLGNTLKSLGRLGEAEASYRQALQIKPDYAEAYYNLGFTLKCLNRLDETEASYRRALQIDPHYAEAHYNLGNTLKELNRLEEAVASYRQAILVKPDFAEAYSNLGATLKDMNRLDESEACLRRALEIDPDYVKAIGNLGATLQALNRLDEAEASYRRALQIKPDYAEVYNNLGSVLQEHNLLFEAEANYRHAIEIKPDFAEAYGNLGVVLHEMNRLVEAKACYRQALEIAPEYAPAHLNLAGALAYLSDFDQVVAESNTGSRLNPLSASDWERRLYIYSYHPDLPAEEIYREFVRWGDRFPDPVVDFSSHDRTPGRRLRIGYVSPDFRRHTSRFFFWPLFANHDHAAVELYAYSNVRFEDEFTAGFKELFDHWRPIRGVADDEVARMIREDAIDILVDGCSHMRDDRLGVFTLKPAPIQVTWLGAAWTTGLKAVDYALIDPYMAPEGTLTRETIVRLPHCFVAFRPPEVTAEIAPPPCLKNGYITFGYSGRTERLNHHTFRVWGEILRQNPTARLFLDFRHFADPLTQEHYRQFMTRYGMNPGQVIMRNSANIFAGLNDIDILLDSFPHSGGTMLFDALWMGVPILTLSSRPPVGRIGTSLMINLGLPEWVAENQEEYIAKASTLSRDFNAIAQLRAGMRDRMQNSPIMDGPGFARGVETAYREMFEKWVKKSPPVSRRNLQNGMKKDGDDSARPDKFVPSSKESPGAEEINTLTSLFTGKRYAEAATLAQEMTARFPRHEVGWKILGMSYKQMGRNADALAAMQKAAELSPDDPQVHCNLGVTLHDLGKLVESETSLRRALQIKPDYANAHYNLGATLQGLGRLEEAEASYRRALQISPHNATAYSNLGVTLQCLGRLDEAEACLRQALQISPDFAEAHNNLGNTLKGLGRSAEAEASYRRALQVNPDFADAQYNLGITLQDMRRPAEAEACYRRALQLNPNYTLAHNNLGLILQGMERLSEAEASLRRALQISPDYADAHSNLGATLMAQGRLDEAEYSYRRALEINPGFAQAHSNLGAALQDMGRLDEATVCFRKALEIKPDFSDAHGNLLFALNYHPDMSAEEIYWAYQEYDALRGIPLRSTWRAHGNDKNPERRLRIGYVSPDFRYHSCRFFLEPLLAHHDKTQVEVYAYAELSKDDDMTARYKSYVDHWIYTCGMNDEVLAERIRSDGIDILVELAGHTAGNRLLAFARKPAPVSLSWLGYGYTTGLSAIDYYLTDEASAPAGSEGLFAEHPWRISTPAYVYRPAAGMDEVNSLPAQQRGYITFGTLTRSIRVNHRTIRVWADILKAVPNSRLVMNSLTFKTPEMQERIATHFAEHGIGRDRLEIGFHSPPWNVLRGMDIGLDCFPHNSGTTLFETLYMGVPYITLAGRPSVGRLGSSILHGVGHTEWIALSEDDYVAKAVELASDIIHLSKIRATLRDQIERSPLRDEKGFACKVENAYRSMWKIWCKKGD